MEYTKRPKSVTRFPQGMPTFVVALSSQDTSSKSSSPTQIFSTSPQNSMKTITPSISTETVVLDKASLQRMAEAHNNFETKIDIPHPADDSENIFFSGQSEQPLTRFHLNRHVKDSKTLPLPQRKLAKKHVAKIKNMYFKSKRNNIPKNIEKYYVKVKKSSKSSCQIQGVLNSDNISKLMSRYRILKKVLAKENLIENQDDIQRDNISIDSDSFTSSLSSIKKSHKGASEKTLTQKQSSTSSKTGDLYKVKSGHSVIPVTSDNVTPYKSEVTNFGVATTYNTQMMNASENRVITDNKEKHFFQESLTSTETLIGAEIPMITSKPFFTIAELENYEKSDISDRTLVGIKKLGAKSSNISSNDIFVIAKTSSELNTSSFDSTYTVSSTNAVVHSDTLFDAPFTDSHLIDMKTKEASILDSTVDIELVREITPSTSSAAYREQVDNVFVTDIQKNITVGRMSKITDDTVIKARNIFNKPTDLENNAGFQKNLSLPNGAALQAKIDEEKAQKRTCADEIRSGYPSNLPELWDRLILVLDLAVKRLEETLAEKIIKEIKSVSISKFSTGKPIAKENKQTITEVSEDKKATNKAQESCKVDSAKCLQCDLVKNTIIDQLMQKMSVEKSKHWLPSSCSEPDELLLKDAKFIKEYLEILKPPQMKPDEEIIGREDSILSSVMIAPETRNEEENEPINCLTALYMVPKAFLRENVFVISTVPIFLVAVYGIYFFVGVIVKLS